MTIEDQDAEVGRLVRERRDLRARHEALASKGQTIGKFLSSIGKALTVRVPEGPYPSHAIEFAADGSIRVPDEYQSHKSVAGRLPTSADLQDLVDEAKQVGSRLKELDAQLKSFGV